MILEAALGQFERAKELYERKLESKDKQIAKEKLEVVRAKEATAEAKAREERQRNLRNQGNKQRRTLEGKVKANEKHIKRLRGEGCSSVSKDNMQKLAPDLRDRLEQCQADTVKALEEKDAIMEKLDEHEKHGFRLLEKTYGDRDGLKAKELWELVGKKGEEYDLHFVELCLTLLSIGLNCEQASSTLVAFLSFLFPEKKPGKDYRMIPAQRLQEWRTWLRPLMKFVAIRGLQGCVELHEMHDASPRGGFEIFGSMASGVYENKDGDQSQQLVVMDLQAIRNQCSETEAAAHAQAKRTTLTGGKPGIGMELSGLYQRSTISDSANGAVKTSRLIGEQKANHIALLEAAAAGRDHPGLTPGFLSMHSGDVETWKGLSPEERKTLAAYYTMTCRNHGYTNWATASLDNETSTKLRLLLLQQATHIIARSLLWNAWSKKSATSATMKSSGLFKDMFHRSHLRIHITATDNGGYSASIGPENQNFDGSPLQSSWDFLRSFSHLIATGGDHGPKEYYLNEQPQYAEFCRRPGTDIDVTKYPIVPYLNSRMMIHLELAACLLPHIAWTLKYLDGGGQPGRRDDPNANELIMNVWRGVNDRLVVCSVAARALKFVLLFKPLRFFANHKATRRDVFQLETIARRTVESWSNLDTFRSGRYSKTDCVSPAAAKPGLLQFPLAVLAKFTAWEDDWNKWYEIEGSWMQAVYESATKEEDWQVVSEFMASSSAPTLVSMDNNNTEDFSQVEGAEKMLVTSDPIESVHGTMSQKCQQAKNFTTSLLSLIGLTLAQYNHTFEHRDVQMAKRGAVAELTYWWNIPKEIRFAAMKETRRLRKSFVAEAKETERGCHIEKLERRQAQAKQAADTARNKAIDYQVWSKHPVAKSEAELTELVKLSVKQAIEGKELSGEELHLTKQRAELGVLRDQIRVRTHLFAYKKGSLPKIAVGPNLVEHAPAQLERLKREMRSIIDNPLPPSVSAPLALPLRPSAPNATKEAQAVHSQHLKQVIDETVKFCSLLDDEGRMTIARPPRCQRRSTTSNTSSGGSSTTRPRAARVRAVRNQANEREQALEGERFMDLEEGVEVEFEVLEVQFSEEYKELVVTYFDVQEVEHLGLTRDDLLNDSENDAIEWSKVAEVTKLIKATKAKAHKARQDQGAANKRSRRR